MFIIISDVEVLENFLESARMQEFELEAMNFTLSGKRLEESVVVFAHPCSVGSCTLAYTFGDVVCVNDLTEFVI